MERFEETTEAEIRLQEAQERAAGRAATIGEFRSSFRAETAKLLKMDGSGAVQERLDVVEEATDGVSDISLSTLEANTLGMNTIGGGRSSMELNRDMFARMTDMNDAESVHHTVAHEAAHGEQAMLQGTLEFQGQQVDSLLLYEGHAEITANEKVGMGKTEHRDGQPKEVYREGQNVVVDILQRVSRAKFERVLTETGDLSELQEAIDRKEQGSEIAA